jgi:hypothetical protein
VFQDRNVAGDSDEKAAAESRIIRYNDMTWLKITSITFTSPPGHEFRKFRDFVDIHGSVEQSSAGVAIGENGAPLADKHQIKVYALIQAQIIQVHFRFWPRAIWYGTRRRIRWKLHRTSQRVFLACQSEGARAVRACLGIGSQR